MKKQMNTVGYKKFLFFTIILLATRIADMILTYIGTPDLSKEANPLVYVLGFGWKTLIIVNAIVSILAIILFYYSFVKYKSDTINCNGFKQYLSMISFNRPDKFIWVFYKSPNNKKYYFSLLACSGYIFALVIPISSTIAIMEWIISSNIKIKFPYHINLKNIVRIDFIIFVTILTIIIYFYWYYKEYKLNKIRLEENMVKNNI